MADMTVAVDIAQNLAAVRTRMVAAAARAGRMPAEITLVAVSKTKPIEAVAAAYAAGQRDFGENRLEELWEKVRLAEQNGLTAIRWHLIGTIQSRKTDQAIGPFVLIHAVDRVKIGERLSRDAQAANCVLSVLLEVNISGEASKHGFSPAELRQSLLQLATLPGIRIEGLMTMAPLVVEPEETRPVFRSLGLLHAELKAAHPDAIGPHLSMGMTNDFEVAIEEGATMVRVGSAIFGERS
jgi:PLP dependent protein